MDIRSIARWLKNPSEMDENSLALLETVSQEYPYFQLPAVLYLKNLAILNRSYAKELENRAIQIADRKRLMQFLDGKPLSNFPFIEELDEAVKKEIAEDSNTTNTLQKKSESPAVEETNTSVKSIKTEHHHLSDDILILEENQDNEDQTEISDDQPEKDDTSSIEVPKRRKKVDLGSEVLNEEYNPDDESNDPIDRFLANMPGPIRVNEEGPVEKPVTETNDEPEIEEIASEPLARIYAMQGLTDKAISIYEKLRLKYPEKSAYFAVQIENLHNKIK
jgi:hypothetical protein